MSEPYVEVTRRIEQMETRLERKLEHLANRIDAVKERMRDDAGSRLNLLNEFRKAGDLTLKRHVDELRSLIRDVHTTQRSMGETVGEIRTAIIWGPDIALGVAARHSTRRYRPADAGRADPLW